MLSHPVPKPARQPYQCSAPSCDKTFKNAISHGIHVRRCALRIPGIHKRKDASTAAGSRKRARVEGEEASQRQEPEVRPVDLRTHGNDSTNRGAYL